VRRADRFDPDKAAQAAAQAAQTAALQAQFQHTQLSAQVAALTPDQALLLLQQFGLSNNSDGAATSGAQADTITPSCYSNASTKSSSPTQEERLKAAQLTKESSMAFAANYPVRAVPSAAPGAGSLDMRPSRSQTLTSFSPFSPEPNLYLMDHNRRDSVSSSHPELLPHPSKSYAPGFGPPAMQTQDNALLSAGGPKVSPTSTRPPSTGHQRYAYLDSNPSPFQINRAPSRPEGPLSRPSSSSQSSRSEIEGTEHDVMHDLNGTLASLNLDSVWKGLLDGSPALAEGPTPQSKSSNTLSHSLSTP
jgi:hypothetical protein